MSGAESSVKCKAFVTEAEIEEQKKVRQEEWEKVRKPDDPLEAPEETYDPRSLYDRLQEQKDKRQAEFEESHRLKNLIKGLDDDEVAFLELVDKTKIEMETKLWQEEVKEIQEFKKAVAHLSEVESEARLKELRRSLKMQNHNALKNSQQDNLAMAVKRKNASNGSTSQEKRQCLSSKPENSNEKKQLSSPDTTSDEVKSPPSSPTKSPRIVSQNARSLQCLGVLPGLGAYSDSSDSENSSYSETEKDADFDLIGRKRIVINSTDVISSTKKE